MPTRRITEPTPEHEPVTLAAAKRQCRIELDDTSDDETLQGHIAAAREAAEDATNRTFARCERELVTDAFSAALRLDFPRVLAVLAVEYMDPDGVQRTLDLQDYVLDAASDLAPAWLVPAPGRAWPATAPRVNAVRVRYACGFESPQQCPRPVVSWMLVHIQALYDGLDRMPEHVNALLRPHSVLTA